MVPSSGSRRAHAPCAETVLPVAITASSAATDAEAFSSAAFEATPSTGAKVSAGASLTSRGGTSARRAATTSASAPE